MSYHERCDTLNKNPVLVVRHFQYGVEQSFKTITLYGSLGKTNYYTIPVQFQVRGSLWMPVWILNSSKLAKFNIEEYTSWVDSIILTNLLHPHSQPDKFDLLKTYQIQSADDENEIIKNRKLLLKKVRQHVNTELNPSKKLLRKVKG